MHTFSCAFLTKKSHHVVHLLRFLFTFYLILFTFSLDLFTSPRNYVTTLSNHPNPPFIMWPPMARMLCRSGFDRSTPPSCLTQHTSNFRHRHQSIPCPGLRSTSIVSEPFRPPASACRSFVKHCSDNTPRLCAFTPDWPLIRTRPFIADSCPI